MPELLSFIFKRQTGLLNHKNLNLNFALKRLFCQKTQEHTVYGSESEVPPFACEFRKDNSNANVLAVATEEGDLQMINTFNERDSFIVNSWTAHSNAVFDVRWLPDKPCVISASGDNTAVLWDVETKKRISTFKKHTGSVKCVSVCHQQSSIFSTGSRDGSINIWDLRIKYANDSCKPEITVTDAHNLHYTKTQSGNENKLSKKKPTCHMLRSVTSVVFQDQHHMASSGVADGVVKIWDLRKSYVSQLRRVPLPKYALPYAGKKSVHGCTNLVFDSTFKNLYVCCTNNTIVRFDCHTYSAQPVSVYNGFRASTYFVKMAISNDDQYLLCGSSDDNAYIWRLSEPGLPCVDLVGHSAEVTAVTWHPTDMTHLVTCGDDNRVLFWKVQGENVNPEDSNVIGYAKQLQENISTTNSVDISETDEPQCTVTTLKSPASKMKPITQFFLPLNPNISFESKNSPVEQVKNSQNCSSNSFVSGEISHLSFTSKKRKIVDVENESPTNSPDKTDKALKPNVLSPKSVTENEKIECSSVCAQDTSKNQTVSLYSPKDKENWKKEKGLSEKSKNMLKCRLSPYSPRRKKFRKSERCINTYFSQMSPNTQK